MKKFFDNQKERRALYKKLRKAFKEKAGIPESRLFGESKEQLEGMDTELRTVIDLLTPFATTRTETQPLISPLFGILSFKDS